MTAENNQINLMDKIVSLCKRLAPVKQLTVLFELRSYQNVCCSRGAGLRSIDA